MVLWPHKGRGLSLVDPSILLGNFLGFVKLDLLLGISSLHDTRVILLSNRLLLDLVASTLLLQATSVELLSELNKELDSLNDLS